MRRPKFGRRLCIGLGGLLIVGGCSHYAGRQDIATPAASAGVRASTTVSARKAAPGGECGAEFDLPAVRAELAGFPGTVPTAARVSRTPRTRIDSGQMGVCVVQMPAVPQDSLVRGSGHGTDLMPAYLPEAAGVPETPPLYGPGVQLSFVKEEHGSRDTISERTLAVVPTARAKAEYQPANVLLETPAVGPRAETAPRRKSFVDFTASPCFGHAPDYAWLCGQVEHSRILGAWRLRYASVDESDRFGGSVTLVENTHVSHLHDGEYIRVEGYLMDPSSTDHSPAYKIQTFRIIDKPNDP